jgi:hypothetical protein
LALLPHSIAKVTPDALTYAMTRLVNMVEREDGGDEIDYEN